MGKTSADKDIRSHVSGGGETGATQKKQTGAITTESKRKTTTKSSSKKDKDEDEDIREDDITESPPPPPGPSDEDIQEIMKPPEFVNPNDLSGIPDTSDLQIGDDLDGDNDKFVEEMQNSDEAPPEPPKTKKIEELKTPEKKPAPKSVDADGTGHQGSGGTNANGGTGEGGIGGLFDGYSSQDKSQIGGNETKPVTRAPPKAVEKPKEPEVISSYGAVPKDQEAPEEPKPKDFKVGGTAPEQPSQEEQPAGDGCPTIDELIKKCEGLDDDGKKKVIAKIDEKLGVEPEEPEQQETPTGEGETPTDPENPEQQEEITPQGSEDPQTSETTQEEPTGGQGEEDAVSRITNVIQAIGSLRQSGSYVLNGSYSGYSSGSFYIKRGGSQSPISPPDKFNKLFKGDIPLDPKTNKPVSSEGFVGDHLTRGGYSRKAIPNPTIVNDPKYADLVEEFIQWIGAKAPKTPQPDINTELMRGGA